MNIRVRSRLQPGTTCTAAAAAAAVKTWIRMNTYLTEYHTAVPPTQLEAPVIFVSCNFCNDRVPSALLCIDFRGRRASSSFALSLWLSVFLSQAMESIPTDHMELNRQFLEERMRDQLEEVVLTQRRQ